MELQTLRKRYTALRQCVDDAVLFINATFNLQSFINPNNNNNSNLANNFGPISIHCDDLATHGNDEILTEKYFDWYMKACTSEKVKTFNQFKNQMNNCYKRLYDELFEKVFSSDVPNYYESNLQNTNLPETQQALIVKFAQAQVRILN